jgi:hypothetical protein
MRTSRRPRIDATILGAASILAIAMGGSGATETVPTERFETAQPPAVAVQKDGAAQFVGVWMTDDNKVRLDIAADGSFERGIVGRKKSARGTYLVSGTRLLLRDESGVRTTVSFGDGHAVMAGYELARI